MPTSIGSSLGCRVRLVGRCFHRRGAAASRAVSGTAAGAFGSPTPSAIEGSGYEYGRLRAEEIAQALDLVDRMKLRADQNLVEAARRDILDAAARLVRRADEIDRGECCQFGRFRPFLEVHRAV